MGIYDRDYFRDNYQHRQNQHRQAPNPFQMPRLTGIVKTLIIINVAVFVFDALSGRLLTSMFALFNDGGLIWQLWRLIGYQFLHAGVWHLALNMLGLYFLGNTLENAWGSQKFLKFYLGCGVAGGIFFLIFTAFGFIGPALLIGASGGVLGLLAACAILYPHFIIFVYFIPVPIRKAAIFLPAIYLLTIITGGHNSGGDAAHLGGMAAGAAYILFPKYKHRLGLGSKTVDFTAYFKHTTKKDAPLCQLEVDRILKKVHEHGLHSLTETEKQTLRKATEHEQKKM